jgi:hypothetical protein
MLDSPATWFTSENIHDYELDPQEEEHSVVLEESTIVGNGRKHPRLEDTPEPEVESKEDSQFHTQAPRMGEETQIMTVEEAEMSKESEFSWEATQKENVAGSRTKGEEEALVEWDESPVRPPRFAKMVSKCDGPL